MTDASNTANAPVKRVHVSAASGGVMNCVRLEAKQAYYMSQIDALKAQNIAVPPYLAGYASAAADSLEILGCPLTAMPKALV